MNCIQCVCVCVWSIHLSNISFQETMGSDCVCPPQPLGVRITNVIYEEWSQERNFFEFYRPNPAFLEKKYFSTTSFSTYCCSISSSIHCGSWTCCNKEKTFRFIYCVHRPSSQYIYIIICLLPCVYDAAASMKVVEQLPTLSNEGSAFSNV